MTSPRPWLEQVAKSAATNGAATAPLVFRPAMILRVKCVWPRPGQRTQRYGRETFSAEVLFTGRRDGEVVCC